MIKLSQGFVTLTKSWDTFKDVAAAKGLRFQYENETDRYQVFAVDGSLLYITNIFKGSIPGDIGFTQSQNDAWKADFELNFKSGSNRPTVPNADQLYESSFRTNTPVTGTSYFLVLDRDNSSGIWKHPTGSQGGIKIFAVVASAAKSRAQTQWVVRPCVVTAINTLSATLVFARTGIISLRETSLLRSSEVLNLFPVHQNLTVVSGSLLKGVPAATEVTTAVNTTTGLRDTTQTFRTPGVGDLIIKFDLISGNGNTGDITSQHSFWYLVE